jgi:CDP-glucose 4,6-dehydratase
LEKLEMKKPFWQDKRVFLTGHTGFKGGWLSLWLQQLGAEVTGYALEPSTQPSLFEVAYVERDMRSIIGDVRDGQSIKRAMNDACPEVVIHMAAQPLVRYSYSKPVETYETNIMGLVHLLEAVRTTPSVKAVVNVTSDKCYENKEWPWGYRENEPMGGYDPYSNSKGCAELITACYRNTYFNSKSYDEHDIAIASARAGNVIGGGDWAQDRLIPDMIRAISKSESLQIRNPNAIRPWQHVLEPLSGYLVLAEKLYTNGTTYAEGWNFGPFDNEAETVEWIIERLVQKWGSGAEWSVDNQQHPHEAIQLRLDCSKARSRLDWHPRWGIDQTIDKIVDWHKAFDQGADMYEVTLAQINSYLNP